MKKILSLNIIDKKILNLLKKCNIIGFLFCLISFLFTYYYYELFQPNILNISLLLFETGLSIKVGSLISGIIIQDQLK